MNAYIVAGFRTAVGKAPRGKLRFVRPDDLAATVIKHLLASVPNFDPNRVDDLIVGNAMPEAEQGLNMARMIALMSLPVGVPGVTVNRYCASGLETIAMAAAKIHAGLADAIIAGGTESMSLVPVGGYKLVPNYEIAKNHPDWYYGMGLTAEEVAKDYKISREDADVFSYNSHQKAIKAIQEGKFKSGIAPVTVQETYLDENMKRQTREYVFDTDEGPRADTDISKLAKLKPVFAANGVVTAGNSSQTSDGAAFVLVVSEKILKEFNLTPIAQLIGYGISGCEPRIMGIGPIYAIPAALKNAGLKIDDIEQIELNEAFAVQSLAVIRTLGLDESKINVNGGAIALGHPLGCSGAKLTVQLLNEMRLRKQKYGMVSACVGGGQGIAGIFELLN
ncbi:MAG: acetyl-CoA C-acyltransferase [Bacteroidia bacterium]|nr:acetyl-CoA C-acyltransferase [Bacteroidia bacterium]